MATHPGMTWVMLSGTDVFVLGVTKLGIDNGKGMLREEVALKDWFASFALV